jgi:hypothetical protein
MLGYIVPTPLAGNLSDLVDKKIPGGVNPGTSYYCERQIK